MNDQLITEAHRLGIDAGWHTIGITPVKACGCSACKNWRADNDEDWGEGDEHAARNMRLIRWLEMRFLRFMFSEGPLDRIGQEGDR